MNKKISFKKNHSKYLIFVTMLVLLIFGTFLTAPVGADPALTLAARWDFNEGEGQIANDIAGSNDFGRLGATDGIDNYDPVWVPGQDIDYGTALLFDGANDYVKVEDSNSLDITGNITVEAWIKPMSAPLPFQTIVVSKWGLQNNQRSYILYIRENNVRFLYSHNGYCCYGVISASVDMNDYIGSWVHIAGTFDGTARRVYINGVEHGVWENSAGGFASTAPLYIGSFVQNDRPFKGYIDEVRVWDNALDAHQLADMTGPVVSNLVANPISINTVPNITFDVSDGTGTGVGLVEYRVDGVDTWISAVPSFDEPGVHTIEIRGTDYALNKGEVASTLLAVYDPSSGFVTGGGWIDSPSGAYLPDPSLSGKATLGFVSKYKKGTMVPTGNTEFQFHVADLNFKSTSYDWLVVTGDEFARFKGTGTINGMGEYKFMIWAGDGETDTFRIKIWEEDEFGVETVVYDNGFDQAINGGSIVVHTGK